MNPNLIHLSNVIRFSRDTPVKRFSRQNKSGSPDKSHATDNKINSSRSDAQLVSLNKEKPSLLEIDETNLIENFNETKEELEEVVNHEVRRFMMQNPNKKLHSAYKSEKRIPKFPMKSLFNKSGNQEANHYSECKLEMANGINTLYNKIKDLEIFSQGAQNKNKLSKRIDTKVKLKKFFFRQLMFNCRNMVQYGLKVSDVMKIDFGRSMDTRLKVELFTNAKLNNTKYLYEVYRQKRLLMFLLNEKGQTTLNISVRRGDSDMVFLLCLLKGPKNMHDDDGMRPIDIAVQNNNEEIVKVRLALMRYFFLLEQTPGELS